MYGSEKKTWFEREVALYNAQKATTKSGKLIRVTARGMGSGEIVQDILAKRASPHVFSPASQAYVELLNDGWLTRDAHVKPIAPEGEPLILSPLVIAMWKPMAEALGFPEKALGWKEIIAVSQEAEGWKGHGRPEWGRFKLGHTHPEYSNSGLLSVLAEAYAGAGKTRDLQKEDLAREDVRKLVAQVEASVVHYGKNTGLFSDQMAARGPSYLSAAVLYENLVVESRAKPASDTPPLVAIYPVEGTFWSDHPFCVLDAPWVSAEQREAALSFLQVLRGRPAQERALALGFRPADPNIAVTAPIDAAHGVDPKQPQTLLDLPDGGTLSALLKLFREVKKSSNVALVFDKSGSMKGAPMTQAKAGARAFLESLDARDEVSLVFFDGSVQEPIGPLAMAGGRAELEERIAGVIADGGTALHDAVSATYARQVNAAATSPDRIHALVVMTDGQDEDSNMALEPLLTQLAHEGNERHVRVFTIAYGSGSQPQVLKRMADVGGGSFAKGSVDNIVQVYRDIASFF